MDGLERDARAALVAREDVELVGGAEGAELGEAVQNVAYMLGVYGLAGGIELAGVPMRFDVSGVLGS
jgi:hypothetical protein